MGVAIFQIHGQRRIYSLKIGILQQLHAFSCFWCQTLMDTNKNEPWAEFAEVFPAQPTDHTMALEQWTAGEGKGGT